MNRPSPALERLRLLVTRLVRRVAARVPVALVLGAVVLTWLHRPHGTLSERQCAACVAAAHGRAALPAAGVAAPTPARVIPLAQLSMPSRVPRTTAARPSARSPPVLL